MSNEFIAIDFYIVGIYLLLIIGIGLYVSRKRSNTSEYFLADRNVGWFVIGSALFASNIGSEHLVGLAGSFTYFITFGLVFCPLLFE